ncbi:MAG: DUF4041 domain-containing protein [Bacillota bacterium]|jgi:predicted nuclease with TOPRIM domain
MFCANCGTKFEGEYCPKCGLRVNTSIKNVKPVIQDQKEKGFFLGKIIKQKDLTPEQKEYQDIKAQIFAAKEQLKQIEKQIINAQNQLERTFMEENEIRKRIYETQQKLLMVQNELIETEEEALLQSFGMYTPHYSYSTSDEYKSQIKSIRDIQKSVIKAGNAALGNDYWQVNGSSAKGRKMVKDTQKLLLRAFNAECDDAIEHVRFNNIEACEKRINSSAAAISKLGGLMEISIAENYKNLKIAELRLMHEYQVKKQEEKEEAKEARQRQREEAKAAKELENERKKLEKEQSHYENAFLKITQQIENASDKDSIIELEKKKEEIENQLVVIRNEMKDVDYRAANQKAGYVYVISNIGAFGEDIYKIGMTRRLDPMDRVSELGDASVPFNFDVHAMIFTDDAPKLEAALHNAFADKKLNFINQRREFFNVTLEEIKEVIRNNYDKTVEFVDVPPAEQYRESLILKNKEANARV